MRCVSQRSAKIKMVLLNRISVSGINEVCFICRLRRVEKRMMSGGIMTRDNQSDIMSDGIMTIMCCISFPPALPVSFANKSSPDTFGETTPLEMRAITCKTGSACPVLRCRALRFARTGPRAGSDTHNDHTSMRACKQASKKASMQASKHASRQTSKQERHVTCREPYSDTPRAAGHSFCV